MDIVNEFLLDIGKKARVSRKSYWEENDYSIRFSEYQEKKEAGLWFKTLGCSYDHQGGCIMCDYSIGRNVDFMTMVDAVKKGLESIKEPCNQLLVSPSGSMLDENEVPREVLQSILIMLANTSHEKFSFETRVDTINEEVLAYCKSYLGNRFYRLFVGLECANEWVLKYCINKQLHVSRFAEVMKVMKEKKIQTAANIIISIPFLTEQENIDLAVESVKWAVSQGCEECFLFPLHVKEATPLQFLYKKGIFSPPKLWQLVEIINRLGKEYYNYIRLSWYTSYNAFNVISSPQTCPKCYKRTIRLLDHFAIFQDAESIIQLNCIECECKKQWYDSLNNIVEFNIPERVIKAYKVLANQYLGKNYWNNNSQVIIDQILKDAESGLFNNDGTFIIG